MKENVDVAIAGAGVAGCLAARDLARAGRSVLLVERKSSPSIGHDWWDNVRADMFDAVDMPRPEPPEQLCTAGPATVVSPGRTARIPVDGMPGILTVDRRLLAKRQLQYAQDSGVRLMEDTAVMGPIMDGDTVSGILVRNSSGETCKINAKLVIDSTGVSSALRTKLPGRFGFPRFMERESMFVTHREVRENRSAGRESAVYFDLENGISWENREVNGMVDLLAGRMNFPGRRHPRIRVHEIVEQSNGNIGSIVRGGQTAPIPVRHCFDSFVAPGFMLCGDSACQCNPMNGAGIASSLRAARIAARVANEALDSGSTGIEALWPYNTLYKHAVGTRLVPYHVLQKLLVYESKSLVEILFRRGLIHTDEFWDQEEAPTEIDFRRVLKTLKIIERPTLIYRLARIMNTAKSLSSHFMDYPEKFNENNFALWIKKKEKLFSSVAGMYRGPSYQ